MPDSGTPPKHQASARVTAPSHAEQRRNLVKKMAAGAFGAPAVLASLAGKAAAGS